VNSKTLFKTFAFLALIAGLLYPPALAQAARSAEAAPRPASEVTAYDLIVAMNSLRVSNGLPALVEDSIIDAVAQSTAQTMANNQMSWHIGNVSGRLAASGYGGGSTVWGTENFAVGTGQSIDEIMLIWADPDHMLPATIAAYCNVGAGTAQAANGMTYYILQAAYTAGKSCGAYTTSGGATTSKTGGSTGSSSLVGGGALIPGVSQIIVPVKLATPDADGKIFHEVKAGQSFWAIAIAYKITIKDLKTWNNLSQDSTLKMGEKLFIPGSNTAGYATPTRTGGIQISEPDAVGRVTHVVQSYQTLSTISIAYGTSVEKILSLNGLQVDWPLRIGQKLVIKAGNVTPTPDLSPIQRLTPDADGKYYHIVRSGETLYWIASQYGVSVNNLMAWNGLTADSIIKPDEKLLLNITPPVTDTATPPPPSITPTVTETLPPPTPTLTPTAVPIVSRAIKNPGLLISAVILLVLGALALAILFYPRPKTPRL
jgi:LysM repeat protein/uncharacterized protein YkwD